MEEYKKKYEKTEERAKNIYNSDPYNSIVRAVCEQIFPELKESKDEKIRKMIRGWIYTQPSSFFDNGISKEEMLAWLEKQDEKNLSTDFSDLRTWKYIVDAVWTEKEGIGQYLDSPFTEETAKKLQKRFGNIEQKVVKFMTKSYITPNPEFFQWIYNRLVYQHHENPNMDYMLSLKERIKDMQEIVNVKTGNVLVKQKPAWSEEDDRIRYAICDTFDRIDEHIMEYNHQLTHQQIKDWLKSLKERMKGEKSCGSK